MHAMDTDVRRRSALALVLAVALLSVGCVSLRTIDPIVLGPVPDGPSTAMFERLLSSARARGYTLELAQPSRGRFGMLAHYTERSTRYRIAVECFRDGRITVTPIGPAVERFRGRLIMPARLHDELVELARALEAAARRPS